MADSEQADELPGVEPGASEPLLDAGLGATIASAPPVPSGAQSDAVRVLLEGRTAEPIDPDEFAARGNARPPGETRAPALDDEPDLARLIDEHLSQLSLAGGHGEDVIQGGEPDERIDAFGGDDTVHGGGGDDLILGDRIDARASYDALVQSHDPVAFFRFDEATGGSAADAVLANDGALRNGAGFVPGGAYTDSGGSISFDGQNDYLQIPHSDAYQLDEGYLQFWFKPDDLDGTQGLVSKDAFGYGSGGHLEISVTGDGTVTASLQSSGRTYSLGSGAGAAAEGESTHVIFGWGDGGMKLYVDGSLVGSDSYSGGLQDNREPLVVGASSRYSSDYWGLLPTDFFDGRIDAVSIHSGGIDDATAAAFFGGASGTADLPGDDLLFGEDGDDIVIGGDGDDSLNGGSGDDLLAGQGGDDLLVGDSLEPAGGGTAVETNVIEVRLGGTSYRPESANPDGAPHYVIRADGEVIAEGYVTWARPGPFDADDPSNWQTLSIHWPNGGTKPQSISVEFTNDAYGGTASTDRNLHVDGLSVNGTSYDLGWNINAAGSRTQNTADADEPVTVATSTVSRTVVEADFSGGAGEFVYRDDPFGGTSQPAYASGSLSGGALHVELGGVNEADVHGMSGGWTTAFALDGDATGGILTFSYRLSGSTEFEPDEYSAVLVSIDGELVSADGSGYVAIVGGGGDSGWRTVTIALDGLSAGEHSLTIGGGLSKKTTASESARISIDNVTLNYDVVTAGEVAAGDDTLLGGEGDDTLYGNGGDDSLYGGTGDDSLYGGGGDDALSGGEREDTLYGNGGDDSLLGGSGDDLLYGDGELTGGAGAAGAAGNDVIEGGDGNDTIFGNGEHDTLYGGAGDDLIYGDGPSARAPGGGEPPGPADLFPTYGHAISNVVLYLVSDSGHVKKVKIEDFDRGSEEVHDPDNLPIAGFVAAEYPGYELIAATVKAGNNKDPDVAKGEGQLVILDDSYERSDLPLSSKNYHEHDYSSTLGSGNYGDSDGRELVFSSSFEGADDDFERAPFDGWSSQDGKVEIRYGEGVGGSDAIELNEDPGNHFPDARDIYRDVATEAGATYTLDFQYAARPGYDASVTEFQVLVDGQVVGSFAPDGTGDSHPDYQGGSISFTGTGGIQRIAFVAVGTDVDQGRGAFLDEITLVRNAPDDDGGDTGLGQPGRDVLFGGEGDDTLVGNEDDDTLDGGVGDDLLIGDGGLHGLTGVSGRIDGGNFAGFVSGTDSTSGAAAPVVWVDSSFGSGFGVQPAQNGGSPVPAETGFNPATYRSEALTVDFGRGIASATVELTAFFVDEASHPEVARWEAFRDGELIAAGLHQQTAGGTATLEIDLGGQLFDTLVFRGETYGRDYHNQGVANDSSDFLISRIDWTAPDGSEDEGFGNVVGLPGDDTLLGGEGHDSLFGNRGDDVLDGGTGDDLLSGGSGNDFLDGWLGNDTVIGGAGDDTIMWDSADSYIRGGSGHDTLVGYEGDDWIFLDGAAFGMGEVANGGFEVVDLGNGGNFLIGDGINGGDTSLTVYGGDGNDWISTWGQGDDVIYGGGGALDQIWGGAGDDVIHGGAGVDYIYGGAGTDTLIGGADYDVFYVGRGDGQTEIHDDAGPNDFFGDTRDGNGLVLFWGYNDVARYEGVGSEADSFALGQELTRASQIALTYDDDNARVMIRVLDGLDAGATDDATVSFDYGVITALNLWDVAGGGAMGYEPYSGERDITRFEWDAENQRFIFQGLDLAT